MAVLLRSDLRRFTSLFVGRRSDYAIQQANGRYRRVGQLLTVDVLRGHLLGWHTIGTYLYDERGLCREAVFDADSVDGLPLLAEVQALLAEDTIPSYLEASRRGGHLRVCLSSLTLASAVRRWLLPYCPDGVEFYPKQDEGERGYGSLIRLPLGVHQVTGRRYPFVSRLSDGSFAPVAPSVSACVVWLSTVERVSVPLISPVRDSTTSDARRPAPPLNQPPSLAKKASAPALMLLSDTSIQAWCRSQDALSVIGRYVRVDRRGMGCCPFGEHHTDGKDSNPSFRAYAPRSSSSSCWYCYTWQRGSNLFDFLLLWHNVDAKTLWHRILTGEIF